MGANGISNLPNKEQRQIAKLNLAAAKSGESYNIDYLPTSYNANTVVNNSKPLLQGRPWIERLQAANPGITIETGEFVVMLLGQSELEHVFRTEPTYITNMPLTTLSNENLTIITQVNSEGVDPISDPVVTQVTQANLNDGSVSRAIGLISEFLNHLAPGKHFIVVDAVHDGSGRDELVDDADTNRKWEDLTSVMTALSNNSWNLNSVIEWWYSKDINSINNLTTNYSPHYLGILENGTTFTIGNTHTDGVDNADVDHIFWDATAPADQLGRGIFSKAGVSHMVIQPMPFQSGIDDVTENFNSTYLDGIGSINTTLDKIDTSRDDIVAFSTHLSSYGVNSKIGLSGHNIVFGGPTGTGHPNVDSDHGLPQVAYMLAIAIAAESGDITLTTPKITSYEYDSESPNRVIANVSLPPTGILTTPRIKNSIAAPGSPSPHQQQIVGFEVARNTDLEADRRPVFLSAETSYPSEYRGLVTILNSATTDGQGNRIGQIAIDMDEPWNNNDRVYFGRGAANALLELTRDLTTNIVPLDLPVVDIPEWEPNTVSVPWNGLPVDPYPAEFTVSGVPAPSGPEPDQFATKTEGDDGYLSGPNVPAATNSITVAIETRIPDAVTNSIDEFFEIQQEIFRIDVDPRAGNRRVRLYAEDAIGTRVVNGALGTGNTIPTDTWFVMKACVDLTNGFAKIWIDDTEVLNSTFTPPTGGNDTFQTNQPMSLGQVSTMGFDIRRLRIWINESTSDGTLPVAAADHDLWGDLSYWNGTGLSAGWSKLGTAPFV